MIFFIVTQIVLFSSIGVTYTLRGLPGQQRVLGGMHPCYNFDIGDLT